MSGDMVLAKDAAAREHGAERQRARLTAEDRNDIQALVLFGTKSPYLRYHFFAVASADKARAFIKFLLDRGPLTVNTAGTIHTDEEREHLVYVGVTWKGLQAFGVNQTTLDSFPAAFRDGARRRAQTLGDVAEDADTWTISDDAAHLVVLLYAREQQRLFDRSAEVIAAAQVNGCALITSVDGAALPDVTHPAGQRITRGVHFGFSDGISQPAIAGERDAPAGGPAAVEPGAFVLGHDDRSAAAANHRPLNPAELGINGTFGAFRIFEQDCDAFEAFLDANSHDEASRELLAARLCGRWRNGVSLAVAPDAPFLQTQPASRDQLNDFDYVPTTTHPAAANDLHGLRCPVGSHVRRANPRSSEILGNAGQTIRLIRRGMPYGPPHVRGDRRKRGMLGLFLCASLERQFEFVMRHWINDGLFARGLDPAERDPFVGATAGGSFSYRTADGVVTARGLSQFITTRAGAYLFFPSRTALALLAEPADKLADLVVPPKPSPAPPAAPAVPPAAAIAIIKDNILKRVGGRTDRDAHPKHHGIVTARFEVIDVGALPVEEQPRRRARLQGVFDAARRPSYRAYIRFSNGSPNRAQPDIFPDLRGIAIKLFDVDGEKLADEARTHDFVLASHPVFFVKNLQDYLRFLSIRDGDEQMRQFPVLREALRSHANPLTIRYFSQTPYRCGPHQIVKYSVVPENPAEQQFTSAAAAGRGANYLRENMAATLASQDVTMRFMVQLAPDETCVDDATAPLKTEFTTVARITIPRQEFRSTVQMKMAEDISFNPWHAIEAHAPLGEINTARLTVYQEVARLRRQNGGVQAGEPNGTEL